MKLYTIGYGNNKPDDFIARLKANGIRDVFDVRRQFSKARIYTYRPGVPMNLLMASNGISYVHCHYLGNEEDSLEEYTSWLHSNFGQRMLFRFTTVMNSTCKVLHKSRMQDFVPCLLCAELDPEKCHRKIVAEALSSEFKQEWEVVHL